MRAGVRILVGVLILGVQSVPVLADSVVAVVADINDKTTDVDNLRVVEVGLDANLGSEVVADFESRVRLVSCHKNIARLLNESGEIFELNINDKSLNKRFSTTLDSREDVKGKVLFSSGMNSMTYVQNEYHVDTTWGGDNGMLVPYSFVLNRINADGSSVNLLKGRGASDYVWRSSGDIIELLAGNRLIQFDEKLGKIVKSSSLPNSKDYSGLHLIKQGYSFFGSKAGVEVRKGMFGPLFGPIVSQIDVDSGFGIVTDFSEARGAFLFFVTDESVGKLYEADISTKNVKLLYSSPFIESACYMN